MGVVYNPSIVTNGLVLYLDGSNLRSYPGSGTTWTDLSGNGNNGSIENGPIFINNYFEFDGQNDQVVVPHNLATMDFSLAQTICMWIKPGSGSNSARRNPYNQAYGGPGTLTREQNGTITYYFGTNGGNGLPYVGRNSSFLVAENELSFISVTRDQSLNSLRWYKNGTLITTANAGGYPTTSNGSSNMIIGQGYVSGFSGSIYNCFIYNKALTADEIRQNYDALKGRYL